MDLITLIIQHGFFQNAMLAGLMASIGCGVMGTYVVVKRISLLAGGIAHCVLGGMGAAYYFGYSPLLGAIVAAVIAALLIGWIHLHWRENEDTVIAALWSVGMATGVIFIANTPGYNVDLMSYLFGNILMVPDSDLIGMAVLDSLILLTVLVFYKPLMAVCFDEEFARLRGVAVERMYLLLLVLIALTVVLLIQVVGLVLVIALLSLPAAAAGRFNNQLWQIMLLATVIGVGFTMEGLMVAYALDWPAGATIIVSLGLMYLLVLGLSRKKHRTRR